MIPLVFMQFWSNFTVSWSVLHSFRCVGCANFQKVSGFELSRSCRCGLKKIRRKNSTASWRTRPNIFFAKKISVKSATGGRALRIPPLLIDVSLIGGGILSSSKIPKFLADFDRFSSLFPSFLRFSRPCGAPKTRFFSPAALFPSLFLHFLQISSDWVIRKPPLKNFGHQ